MSYDPADDAEDYRRENLAHLEDEGQCDECGCRISDPNASEVEHDRHGQVFCDSYCRTLFHSLDTEDSE